MTVDPGQLGLGEWVGGEGCEKSDHIGKLQNIVQNQLVCVSFFGWFCVVLFNGSSPLKKIPQL